MPTTTNGTNIRISDETWRQLNGRKESGQSFDDVIQGLLADGDAADGE